MLSHYLASKGSYATNDLFSLLAQEILTNDPSFQEITEVKQRSVWSSGSVTIGAISGSTQSPVELVVIPVKMCKSEG